MCIDHINWLFVDLLRPVLSVLCFTYVVVFLFLFLFLRTKYSQDLVSIISYCLLWNGCLISLLLKARLMVALKWLKKALTSWAQRTISCIYTGIYNKYIIKIKSLIPDLMSLQHKLLCLVISFYCGVTLVSLFKLKFLMN